MNTTKIIIVVPCYNEEEVLRETTGQLSEILCTMEQQGIVSEGKLLYVDDGSKDATWMLIEQLAQTNPRVIGLKLAHNVGHQQALWAGLEWASVQPYDAIVSIDADLQDDVQAIIEMTRCFNEGCDIVYGVRRERKTDTFFKKHPDAIRVGYCYDFQIVNEVPTEAWDEKLDCIVTNQEIIYVK